MSLFQNRFKQFFDRNRLKINNHEITICIGNEGCDLDSFVSSLIISYAEDVIHVVNMKKEVFKAKGELMYVCDTFKIDIEDLIYLERPLGAMSQEAKEIGSCFLVGDERIPIMQKHIRLFLTDHNEPVRELQRCEISMIIDHHRLEHIVEKAKRIYIDIDVGSATTLVSKYLGHDLSRKNHCIKDPKNIDPDKDTLCVSIAKLLLIPIIVDTKHLQRRTSVFDYLEYKRLKKKANVKKKFLKKERTALKKARLNDSKHTSEIILQKDFKQYYEGKITFGIATVKYDIEKWAEREGEKLKGISKEMLGVALFLVLNEFRKKMGLDFLLVGYKFKEKRYFVVINFPLIDQFADLNRFDKVEYKGLEYFSVPVETSRKIIAPIIRLFLMEKVIK